MALNRTYRFSATIFEKAEHWEFEASCDATSQGNAYNQIRADYPQKDYRIKDVRLDNTYGPNFTA
jgi:hypothetical protein